MTLVHFIAATTWHSCWGPLQRQWPSYWQGLSCVRARTVKHKARRRPQLPSKAGRSLPYRVTRQLSAIRELLDQEIASDILADVPMCRKCVELRLGVP